MAEDLRFTSPEIAPEGLRFEASDARRTWRFVLPREAFAALGARAPRMRDLIPTFQRWRARILAVAETLARRAGSAAAAAPIVITGEALAASFSEG